MLCSGTWRVLWMVVCYLACFCTYFPSHRLCGQNPQQVFSEGKSQRRKNIPDEAKPVKKVLQRSTWKGKYTANHSLHCPPHTPPENIVAKWRSRLEDWGWAVMPRLQQTHQENTMLQSTVKRHQGGPGPSDFVHNLRWADWTLKGGL